MTWCFALCQHPMYMIIEHDETAAERTPPWGEPDISTYIERIRRNLSALDRYPHLKFNYDFSGVELEGLAERAPDVIERLREYVSQGRVGFVDGSYAQAHLQGLGSESSLRQISEGLAAIERIVGVRVRSYAHQEPGLHDQMPQILRALGYRFAVTPGFFWTLSFLTPHEILGVQYQGLRFLQDEEFTQWHGLDGSEIPLYLTQPRLRPKGGVHGSDSHRQALRQEWVKGLLRYPPIRCDFPDMVDIDDEWVADHDEHEFVILDEALERRLAETPERSRARLYTYWGYGEGMEAERLHRADRSAETALLEAESLGALAQALVRRPAGDLSEAWRQLLRAQHHDAYWVAGVGLREKAVGWAQEAQAAAETATTEATDAVAAQVCTATSPGATPLLLWEPWPVARQDVAVAEVTVPAGQAAGLQVYGADDAMVPSQVLSVEPCDGGMARVRLLIRAATRGLGYRALEVRPGSQQTCSAGTLSFGNAFYRATLEADGTFTSLRLVQGDVELVRSGPSRGNMFRAQGPTGEWLSLQPARQPIVTSGPLAQQVHLCGTIGDADVTQDITFYRDLPRIDLTVTFDFRNTSFGDYWQDETKLNVYWPVAPRGQIDHDIPFGVIRGREERIFFPTTWVRLGSERGGLAVFHRGTNRYWVRDHVLANVWACGVYGRDFGTRAQPQMYIKDYDLRLRGRHVISYAIYPHVGDWREARVPAEAFSYQHPLRITAPKVQNGPLPREVALARLENEALVPTALFARGEDLVCRLFETMGTATKAHMALQAPWRIHAIHTLAGDPVGTIQPFTIAEVTMQSRR